MHVPTPSLPNLLFSSPEVTTLRNVPKNPRSMAAIGAVLDADGVGFCWRVFLFVECSVLFLQVNKQKKWSKVEVLENFWLHVLKNGWSAFFIHIIYSAYIYMRYDRRDAYVFTCFTCLDFVQIQTLDHLVSSCGAWLSCLTLPEPKYPRIRTMLILKWYNLYTLIEQWK